MEHREKRKLAYFAMVFYIITYYIFMIFFKENNQYFDIIRIGFEDFVLIVVLFKVSRLNLETNKKSLVLPTVLLAVTFNTIGRFFEFYYIVILKTNVPNNLLIDIFSIIASLVFLIVFILEINKKKSGKSILVLSIDIIGMMCVSLALTWKYIINPNLINLEGMGLLTIILYTAYPIIHLGILSATFILYECLDENDPERKSIKMFIIAFICMYLANLDYTYLLAKNAYNSGNIVKPLWTIYDFFLLIAATKYAYSKDVVDKKDISYSENNLELNSILPGASIVLLFIFTTFESDAVIWTCLGLGIILMIMRHIIIDIKKKSLILELDQLNKCLKGRVDDTTKEIYEVEFYDHLTGLANRRLFEKMTKDFMDECDKEGTKILIILLDLDRFKAINDTYGHSFGDLLIIQIANLLKEIAGEDCFLSRQGGDEFAIAIKNAEDKSKAKRLSEQILNKLKRPINLEGQTVYITCSIGIACYTCDGKTYEEIIGCADIAMYNSKYSGRNTYSFYDESMFKLNSKRMTFERELRNALEKDQFILHYQPQVDTLTKEVVGLEALIRWNHPIQGLISPFEFIGIAEETGLIGPIGEWVIRTACTQTKVWQDRGFKDLKIGVNISAYQFQQENFVEIVRSILSETKINPKYLDLEITESIAMRNEIDVITKLKKLKKLGVQVSMDDFGTGYSSLSYLNRFPIDTLKIPREFIIDIKPYHDKKSITGAIIAIAKNLELSIIAEGVETQIQLDFLSERKCDLIQGYFFSRPLSADVVEDFLNKKL